MWRIVCVGPGPQGTPRRVVDRGPLLPDETRANALAAWLSATGLYERVRIERAGAALSPMLPTSGATVP
jgi:hypothetical protein